MMKAIGATKNATYQKIDGNASANFGPRNRRGGVGGAGVAREAGTEFTSDQAPALAFTLL